MLTSIGLFKFAGKELTGSPQFISLHHIVKIQLLESDPASASLNSEFNQNEESPITRRILLIEYHPPENQRKVCQLKLSSEMAQEILEWTDVLS